MKEAENKVVTPFVAPAELKARQAKAMQSSEDIHVGPNTQLSGGFTTNGMMIVDGKVDSGDVAADRLVVSHLGALDGKAVVNRAEISGVFSGELVAGDEVIVRSTARISGNVECQRLVIHRGARIECTFSCTPEHAPDNLSSGSESGNTTDKLMAQRKSMRQLEDRKVFLAGAGSVLAVVGLFGLIMGFKALLG